jgi:uncharacterized protein DUF6174
MRSALLLGMLTVAVVTVSCSQPHSKTSSPIEQAEEFAQRLAMARAQWESQHLSEYMFRVDCTCYCRPRVLSATVVVRGDSVDLVTTVLADGVPGRTDMRFFTVDQLFDEIERSSPGRCSVRYHESQGFPVVVEFVQLADDSGVEYQIRSLERVLRIETRP